MLMKPDSDYSVLGIHVENSKELVVVSHFSSCGKNWPSILTHNEKEYAYDGLTALPSYYVGHYFSMASYKEVVNE